MITALAFPSEGSHILVQVSQLPRSDSEGFVI